MCLYPKLIDNPKYRKNKKNGGKIPPLPLRNGKPDERVKLVPVGCGKCLECRKKKARNWAVRLQEEIRHSKNGKFVTLTFSNEALNELEEAVKRKSMNKIEGYDLDNAVATLGTRRYLERWRKKYGKSVKHWFITELGQTSTERIHIHGIMWTDETQDIKDIWKYGHVYIGDYVNNETINYIVKYVNKVDKIHKEYQSKILTSAGIGKKYVNREDAKNNKYKGKKTKETYVTREGVKLGLPIYYRNKLYTDEERELLWLDKLDEKKRYVLGQEIDVSTDDQNYYKALKFAREKNKRLGYGDDSINWDRRRYENDIRNIKKMERLRLKKNNLGQKG